MWQEHTPSHLYATGREHRVAVKRARLRNCSLQEWGKFVSRGRKRTPTSVLNLRGSFDKHPEREREREDEPNLPLGVGDPPARFDGGQVEAWNELAEDGAVWLTVAYRKNMEIAAFLLAQWRRAGGGLDAKEMALYQRALSDLHFGAANIKAKAIKKDDAKKTLIA